MKFELENPDNPIEDKWKYFYPEYRPMNWEGFMDHINKIDRMQRWCMNETKGLWTYRVLKDTAGGLFLFTSEKDYIMFVLTWAG